MPYFYSRYLSKNSNKNDKRYKKHLGYEYEHYLQLIMATTNDKLLLLNYLISYRKMKHIKGSDTNINK